MSSTKELMLPIMPETSHEVPAVLLLTINNEKVLIGNANEDLRNPPNVFVRLGTKISDSHPSCVGFRVFLRTETPKSQTSGTIDDNYHVVSNKFDPESGNVTYAEATNKDKQELFERRRIVSPFDVKLKVLDNQRLYRMDFTTADTNGFIVSRHGPDLRTQNGHVRKIDKLIPFIAYASRVSLMFIVDKLVATYLDKAIANKCVGAVGPSWKTALPESLLPTWTSNVQTQMVTGSIDVLNTLLNSLKEQPLCDGSATSILSRPEAALFKDHIRNNYPDVRTEPTNKVHPILLNVLDGVCLDLPFGASMLNRPQTYAGIKALHRLLKASIPASRIGIVTLYPAQVVAYRDGLERCHKLKPNAGYDLVKVDIVDHWPTGGVGIAIVDLVRTSNASGNLGYLSQSNRLKALLTSHCNGLIVVGDRTCTLSANGKVTSTKLDKVLQWFVDHGRIVDISKLGDIVATTQRSSTDQGQAVPPTQPEKTESTAQPMETSNESSASSRERTSSNSSNGTARTTSSRRYVGIPGLEHMIIEKPINENARAPIGKPTERDVPAAWKSFKRQGFDVVKTKATSPNEHILQIHRPKRETGIDSTDEERHQRTSKTFDESLPTDLIEKLDATANQREPPRTKASNDASSLAGAEASNSDAAAVEEQKEIFKVEEAAKLRRKRATDVARRIISTHLTPGGSVANGKLHQPAHKQASSKTEGVDTPSEQISPSALSSKTESADPRDSSGESIATKPTNPFERSSAKVRSPQPHKTAEQPVVAEGKDLAAVESMLEAFKHQCGVESYKALCKEYNIKPDLSNILKDSQTAVSKECDPPVPIVNSKGQDCQEAQPVTPTVPFNGASKPTESVDIASEVPQIKQDAPIKVAPLVPQVKFKFEKANNDSKTTNVFTTLKENVTPAASKLPETVPAEEKTEASSNIKRPVMKLPPHKSRTILPTVSKAKAKPVLVNFRTDYQPRYKAIRSVFAALEGNRDQSREDRLFRCLADAYMDEDANAFDQAYEELQDIVDRVQAV